MPFAQIILPRKMKLGMRSKSLDIFLASVSFLLMFMSSTSRSFHKRLLCRVLSLHHDRIPTLRPDVIAPHIRSSLLARASSVDV